MASIIMLIMQAASVINLSIPFLHYQHQFVGFSDES